MRGFAADRVVVATPPFAVGAAMIRPRAIHQRANGPDTFASYERSLRTKGDDMNATRTARPRPLPLKELTVMSDSAAIVFGAEAGVGGLGLQAASALAGLVQAFPTVHAFGPGVAPGCYIRKRRAAFGCSASALAVGRRIPLHLAAMVDWPEAVSSRQPPGPLGFLRRRESASALLLPLHAGRGRDTSLGQKRRCTDRPRQPQWPHSSFPRRVLPRV